MNKYRRVLGLTSTAVRHPHMAVRRLKGKSPIEIEIDELYRAVPDATSILEAGAADGADTARLATRWPAATIHAFEPVPSSFAVLQERTADLPNVRRYAIALGSAAGTQTLHLSGGDESGSPDASSLLSPLRHLDLMPEVSFVNEIDVQVKTLDDWAVSAGVQSIDLMWLDMQGMELSVLRAGGGILPSVRAVVMEVLRKELYEGSPLYPEVMSWMREQGFRVKIERVSYLFGNVLFVR